MPGPTYLRVVVTARCTLACPFCHMEGDPAAPGVEGGLPASDLVDLIGAGIDNGMRKIKFLGGEPLMRKDLPAIVGKLRQRAPTADLSLITAGAVPPARLQACLESGLSRANMSIHGFALEAFQLNGGSARTHAMRQGCLDLLLERRLPVKLNYVWTGPACFADLGRLLAYAADLPVVVNVLNDLENPAIDHHAVRAAVVSLRGEPDAAWLEPDPDSLATERLGWRDGLVVEIKHQQLGVVAPWQTCVTCTVRKRCREGIHALRLRHEGILQPCMDRTDLGLPLLPILRRDGPAAVEAAWRTFVAGLSGGGAPRQVGRVSLDRLGTRAAAKTASGTASP